MARFNSYVPMWTVRNVMGRPAPSWASCLAWKKYALPAFLADMEYIQQNLPTARKAKLIRKPNVDWAGDPAFRCALPRSRWLQFYPVYRRLPSLISQYIERGAYTDERHRTYLQEVASMAEDRMPLLRIVDALIKENHGQAFADLSAAFSRGRHHAYLRPLTRRLARKYSSDGNDSMALATLDLLARYTTAEQVSRDSLRTWYAEVHPERGLERFRQMTSGPERPSLIVSEKEIDLTGRYQNLTTGEPFDLSQLEGKAVLFDFWTTWCAPCIAEIPDLKEFAQTYGGQAVLVTVNGDPVAGGQSVKEVRQFMEKHGIDYTVLSDEPENSLTEQFGVAGWPSKFLVNGQGKLLKHPVEDARTVSLQGVEAYLDEKK